MNHGALTERRAQGGSEVLESSRFSLSSPVVRCAQPESRRAQSSRFSPFSLGAGGSGRIRENRNAILPNASHVHTSDLQQARENREDNPQLYTCAGATRGDRKYSIGKTLPFPPDSPAALQAAVVWDAFEKKQDIYAIAYRLALPASDTVDKWRLAVLRIARSEGFVQAVPRDMRLGRDDWERWKALEASPRKLLSLLRKLLYGVRIWD